MHKKMIALFFNGLIISSWTNAQDLFDLKINDTVTGQISLGKKNLPLPPGNWTVAVRFDSNGTHTYSSDQSITIPIANALLAKVTPSGQISGLIRFIANEKDWPGATNWSDDPCSYAKTKTSYFHTRFNSSFNFPECLVIRPVINFAQTTGYFGDLRNWANQNHADLPPVMIYSDYERFTSQGFIKASVWFNPELAGFKRDNEQMLAQNSWNVDKIDETKKLYLIKIQDWSSNFAAQIRESSKGNPASLPALP
ncbi:hypothetical protein [Pseudogulbenkiania subflava]|uniref:Uncharacterized protein n=1 Tax=Pseudogulbenkiania subflava DSM 22618 TaxID=1123014 RepID=A0A1Y6BRI5_9NEIS|nr:hypothetical protein [Pseudogulbenkiania subflava]SMF25206.1 hypothetical protein SAMN02745746_02167 [Pseudogulbenkiania subflava DSM 22618]